MYVSTSLSPGLVVSTQMLIYVADKWEDATIRELTPRLLPVFQAVLTGDEDQLEDERRAELIELVKWLNQMQAGAAPWVEQL